MGTGIEENFATGLENAGYPELIRKALEFSDAAVIAHPEYDANLQPIFDAYPRDLFVHPTTDDYVEKYNDFYDNLMEKTPLTF